MAFLLVSLMTSIPVLVTGSILTSRSSSVAMMRTE